MRWIVMTASAQMPSRVRGIYRRVALVKLTLDYAEKGLRPKMISLRCDGVMEVRDLGNHSVGKTQRSAYATALAYAEYQADRLNKEEG